MTHGVVAFSRRGISLNRALLQELVDRDFGGNRTAAANAWGLKQPHLSRLLNGNRGLRRPSDETFEAVRKIAEATGRSDTEFWTKQPAIVAVPSGDADAPRFVYDPDQAHSMLMQIENWFADLPRDARMHKQVVRAVMRTLFDESFLSHQRPSREWRITMDRLEGWPTGEKAGSRRRGAQWS